MQTTKTIIGVLLQLIAAFLTLLTITLIGVAFDPHTRTFLWSPIIVGLFAFAFLWSSVTLINKNARLRLTGIFLMLTGAFSAFLSLFGFLRYELTQQPSFIIGAKSYLYLWICILLLGGGFLFASRRNRSNSLSTEKTGGVAA